MKNEDDRNDNDNDNNNSNNNDDVMTMVSAAIAKAKWNESVYVNVTKANTDNTTGGRNTNSDDSDGSGHPSQHLLLVPQLDRSHGGIQWVNILAAVSSDDTNTNNNTTNNTDTATTMVLDYHLRTKIWIFPMLNDTTRNTLYEQAIDVAAQRVIANLTPNAAARKSGATTVKRLRTLDIGAGTGLLAMMSAKYLAHAIVQQQQQQSLQPQQQLQQYQLQITSLEMASPMATLAQRTIALNQYPTTNTTTIIDESSTNAAVPVTIDVLEEHSCTLPSMKNEIPDTGNTNKADVVLCTSELLESGLFGEGWLPAMRDAWARHLQPGHTVVVPQKARIYAQLIGRRSMQDPNEGATIADFLGPYKLFDLKHQDETITSQLQQQHVEGVIRNDDDDGIDDETVPQPLRLFTTAASSCDATATGMLSDNTNGIGCQVELHFDAFRKQNPAIVQVLSDPIEVLDVDVTHPTTIPSCQGQENKITILPTETGLVDGVLFWWELDLYENITYSTSPYASNTTTNKKKNTENKNASTPSFQDHWHQCLYVFPPSVCDTNKNTNNSSKRVEKGNEVMLLASHTDSRIYFEFDNSNNNKDAIALVSGNDSKRLRRTMVPTVEDPTTSSLVTPRRCWQLNDLTRTRILRNGIQFALETVLRHRNHHNTTSRVRDYRQNNIHVLDISDFSLCGILASLLSNSNTNSSKCSSNHNGSTNTTSANSSNHNNNTNSVYVTSIESSTGGLPLAAAKVAQLGNGLTSEQHQFQIVQCYAESITTEILQGNNEKGHHNTDAEDDTTSNDTGGKGSTAIVDVVVGEPYYEVLEDWSIETAVNYFNTLRMLKRNKIVRTNALCVPSQAIVYACGISCPELGTAYRKHRVGGNEKNSNNNNKDDTVCGFHHRPVIDCWNYNTHAIALPVFDDYNNVRQVTETIEIGAIDYEHDTLKVHHDTRRNNCDDEQEKETEQGTKENTLLRTARFIEENIRCHAIVFWVDYRIRRRHHDDKNRDPDNEEDDNDATQFSILSTGPASSFSGNKQTVRILEKPIATTRNGFLAIEPYPGLQGY